MIYRNLKKIYKNIFSKIKKNNKIKIQLGSEDNINFIKYYQNSIFLIPKDNIRYYGGISFDKLGHPFLKYFYGDKKEIEEFYINHTPKNIFEAHKINFDAPSDSNFLRDPEGSLPWLEYNFSEINVTEGGLKFEDGRQQFGPISKKKLALEICRLDNVLNSIKKEGFVPNLYEGYPRGYFMLNKEKKWIFYIVGGSHRVATLIYLGYQFIPVTLQANYPCIVSDNDIDLWPKIREKIMEKSEGLKIFSSYFH